MTSDVVIRPFDGPSVCLFCGSSDKASDAYLRAAWEFGELAAAKRWRLVYGGGGVGLMGAAARGAHEAGGRVLGVMPEFLRSQERLYDDVETVIVGSMHQRKTLMYDQSDAFVAAPGGIGTLEEVIEVLSWKRLDLHGKPVILLNLDGFWDGLIAVMQQGIDEGLTPETFRQAWTVCDTLADLSEVLDRPRS